MKNLFNQNKSFFIFLIKFSLFYVVFALLYNLYLSRFNSDLNEVDGISRLVANQMQGIMQLFNHNITLQPHEFESSIKILYDGKYVSRIIEGCNAVSVMILFAAFVFSFSTNLSRTIVYILIGVLIIHVLNLIRIGLLTYALYYYPEYQELLHGTIFPLFIYGVVFLLWVFWVTKFSGYDKVVRSK